MELVIDTSSPAGALALLEGGRVLGEHEGERLAVEQLPAAVRRLTDLRRLTAVVIVTGPGSFTGLRAGASYGIGLAQGRGIPLLGLPTLALVRRRARVPATPVVEAGRGRVYWECEGRVVVDEPANLPAAVPVVGLLSERVRAGLQAAGRAILAPVDWRGFGEAALDAVDEATVLPYGRVTLSYVTSVGATRD